MRGFRIVFILLPLLWSGKVLAEGAAPVPPAASASGVSAALNAPASDFVAAPAPVAPPAPPAEVDKFDWPGKLLEKMRASAGRLVDYTATFEKQEYKGGLLPREKISIKYRANPRVVYMKWIGQAKKDQEVIWGPGRNDGKLKAHQGGLLNIINVDLEPNSYLATKDSRHPITHTGFAHLVELIYKDFVLAKKLADPDVKFTDKGIQTVGGVQSQCYEAELPKDKNPNYYAYKAHICMSLAAKLPNKVQVWDKEDGQVRMVEDYQYSDVRVNPGLEDKDFDPKNPEYKF